MPHVALVQLARVLVADVAKLLGLRGRALCRRLQLRRALTQLVARREQLRLVLSHAAREIALDGRVVASDEAQCEVRKLPEGVRLGDRQHRLATLRRKHRDKARVVLSGAALALAQQLDHLGGEGEEVDEDILLRLE